MYAFGNHDREADLNSLQIYEIEKTNKLSLSRTDVNDSLN